jgi:hypothetical protein
MLVPSLLVEAIKTGTLVPFVGAGVSRSSVSSAFPNWAELLNLLSRECTREGHLLPTDTFNSNKVVSAQVLEARGDYIRRHLSLDAYLRIMEEIFDPPIETLDLRSQLEVLTLNSKLIVTTNYDRLLEHAIANSFGRNSEVYHHEYASTVLRKLRRLRQRLTPLVFKLHGDISDPSSIILSRSEYTGLIHQNDTVSALLQALMTSCTFLFIGYSFSDRDLKFQLEKYRLLLRGAAYPHYFLTSEESTSNSIEIELREQFGIVTMKYRGGATGSNLRRALRSIKSTIS